MRHWQKPNRISLVNVVEKNIYLDDWNCCTKKYVESQAKINQFIFHRYVWHSRGKNGEMKKRETRRFLNVKMPFTSILSEKTLRKVEEKEILSCLATFDLRAWERDNRWCQTSLMSRGLKIHPNVLLLRLVNLLKCHKRHDNTNQNRILDMCFEFRSHTENDNF